MTKYTFNSQEYYDLDDLRQAIWSANHLVFGDLTDAPELVNNCLLVAKWCSDFGLANVISAEG